MKAVIVQSDQEDKALVWQDVPSPAYGNDEVLVNIYATALNRADLLQRAGKYPPPPGAPDILGLEMAGQIVALGSQVTAWQVGDRVCALLPGGGYAEQINVPAAMLMPIPPGWTYQQAAAVPEVFFTAFVNLFMEAALQKGETVLIHGAASGVGTAAIQLAHQAGCHVLATAGTDEKTARCVELGAELAVNYKKHDFAQQIKDHMHGSGVDVVLDVVGAAHFERNMELLKLRGRLVFIAVLGGSKTTVDLAALMRRRLRLIGSVLRSRTLAEKIEIKHKFMAQIWPLLENGTIQPVIDSVYSIVEVEAAQQRMVANQNIGKIVLMVRETG